MKEYIPVNAPQIGSTKTTHLKVEIYYSLGGINYFTYKNERRGYYISVSPVERREYAPGLMMEGTTCFSGYKALLKEVSRKSAKAEREAGAGNGERADPPGRLAGDLLRAEPRNRLINITIRTKKRQKPAPEVTRATKQGGKK